MSVTVVEQPRIYVASLADYNNGKLHGVWIDANQDASDIWREIILMLSRSPQDVAEDWAIHDHEGFYSYDVAENSCIEVISTVAKGIKEHGSAYAYYVAWKAEVSEDQPTSENFQECYKGHWESERDFALKHDDIEERYEYNQLPEFWKMQIDWQSVADHIFQDDYDSYQDASYGIHVFKTDY